MSNSNNLLNKKTACFNNKNQPTCKYCLSEQIDEINDPLLPICKCIGSVSLVHFLCLKKWVEAKIEIRKSSCIDLFAYKKLSCEICHCEIPRRFVINSNKKIYDLILPEETEEKYILLESNNIEENDGYTYLYMIKFINHTLTIGRSKENHITIKDSSISKLHATFTFDKDKIYLRDEYSCRGTYVKINTKIQIFPYCPITIYNQTNKIRINYLLEKTFMSFITCKKVKTAHYNYNNFSIMNKKTQYYPYFEYDINDYCTTPVVDNELSEISKPLKKGCSIMTIHEIEDEYCNSSSKREKNKSISNISNSKNMNCFPSDLEDTSCKNSKFDSNKVLEIDSFSQEAKSDFNQEIKRISIRTDKLLIEKSPKRIVNNSDRRNSNKLLSPRKKKQSYTSDDLSVIVGNNSHTKNNCINLENIYFSCSIDKSENFKIKKTKTFKNSPRQLHCIPHQS